MISQEYVSLLVVLLANLLPKVGLVLGTEPITTLATLIITVIGVIWAMYRRHRKGDISIVGTKKLG